jgi:hypothetical protein
MLFALLVTQYGHDIIFLKSVRLSHCGGYKSRRQRRKSLSPSCAAYGAKEIIKTVGGSAGRGHSHDRRGHLQSVIALEQWTKWRGPRPSVRRLSRFYDRRRYGLTRRQATKTHAGRALDTSYPPTSANRRVKKAMFRKPCPSPGNDANRGGSRPYGRRGFCQAVPRLRPGAGLSVYPARETISHLVAQAASTKGNMPNSYGPALRTSGRRETLVDKKTSRRVNSRASPLDRRAV